MRNLGFWGHFPLVYNQNQVSVSRTETKVQFRCRYQSRNFFCQNRNFLFWFKKKNPCFPTSWENIKFEKLKTEHRNTKIVWKSFIFGSKFSFRSTIDFPLKCGFSYLQYRPESISHFGFQFWYRTRDYLYIGPKPKGGFGCTILSLNNLFVT